MSTELFQPEEFITPKWYLFKDSKLGRIYNCIPWDQLAACLPDENRGPGAPRWFSAQGMFGLMFLKSYLNISDEKLIERFNTDWSLQLFCNKLLDDRQKIRDKAIVSRIRTYVAEHTDWQVLQEILINHWKRDMNNTHVLLMDATCYESYIRFPTDVKLLWESSHWIFEKQLYRWCKVLSLKRPRSKYLDQKRRQIDFDRRRRKSYRLAMKRKKALIYLLEKGIDQLQSVLDANPQIQLKQSERGYLRTIKKVLEQQQFLLTHPAKELKDRIVSLPKPYVRPIIRGKETKRVEFGMKAHLLQVDGICLIDHLSFNAFNESTRLKISTLKHRSTFSNLHQLGADRIYATNANRKYLTGKKVFTCFPRKGHQIDTKAEKQLRSAIANQRATVMEGSFGIHKISYGLNKVKAKNKKNEMLWVFFAVMTANAVKISKQMALSPTLQLAA